MAVRIAAVVGATAAFGGGSVDELPQRGRARPRHEGRSREGPAALATGFRTDHIDIVGGHVVACAEGPRSTGSGRVCRADGVQAAPVIPVRDAAGPGIVRQAPVNLAPDIDPNLHPYKVMSAPPSSPPGEGR